jgi:hypothetical protein
MDSTSTKTKKVSVIRLAGNESIIEKILHQPSLRRRLIAQIVNGHYDLPNVPHHMAKSALEDLLKGL